MRMYACECKIWFPFSVLRKEFLKTLLLDSLDIHRLLKSTRNFVNGKSGLDRQS